ncbi:very-long-chain (3R)-3-hydroxyacyl-CoA dehydratase isoform X2 [Onthophagus taurus]|uniref:very-long-chain (3R)-3-hydroxyacyl-CoA dehydratase isoform X2 n=1 Tax=Onthophagus taurus TaxID=166361 RepID=UPI000C205C92|nr:very-long-chain (3R)-3-hydroxyacyl-CoA dehydratase isoform X2 [Onthophagus taurus]
MDNLSPFIYWAQSSKNIFLKVDVRNVKEPQVNIEGRKITFFGEGEGARGLNKYEFAMDFYGDVSKDYTMKIHDSKVDFNLVKTEEGFWPRLISQPQKPAWLKIDFDKWQSEEDLNDEVRDIRDDYPDIYEKLQKEEQGYKKDFKKVFMICHNFFMYLGFFYILCVLGVRFLKEGPDSYSGTYDSVGFLMKLLHVLMSLEIIYPILGYSKGSPLINFMQIFGRCFVLFGMISPEPRMQIKPVVFYLFLVWSSVELVRYPYYITQLYKKENAWLTWLRYTVWIPLYPLGFLCEGIIVLRSIPYAEETKLFTLSLPNYYNFVFDYPTVLRIYMFVFVSSMYSMMSYMYKGRKARLGPHKKSKIQKIK